TPVLQQAERIALGFLLGTTGTMFLSFLGNVFLRIPFTRLGFLSIQLIIVAILALLFAWRRRTEKMASVPALPTSPALAQWAKILLSALAVWTGIKLIA